MAEGPAAQRKEVAPPPAHGEASARVLAGDAIDALASLPDGLAQTYITSLRHLGVFVCALVCLFACVFACLLAFSRSMRRGIPHRSDDRGGAELPTYLRSIEVWS